MPVEPGKPQQKKFIILNGDTGLMTLGPGKKLEVHCWGNPREEGITLGLPCSLQVFTGWS